MPSAWLNSPSLIERLARVIRPTYISAWLNQPMDLLDDDKPIERDGSTPFSRIKNPL